MSIGNILSIPAQSSLPRDPVPDVRELPANCARKAIIPLGMSGIMA